MGMKYVAVVNSSLGNINWKFQCWLNNYSCGVLFDHYVRHSRTREDYVGVFLLDHFYELFGFG